MMGTSRYSLRPLKHGVVLRRGRAEDDASARPYVGLEHIESATGRLLGRNEPSESASTDDSATQQAGMFEPGDVLFGKLRPYLAKAWVANFSGRCTTELLAMTPVSFDAVFLRYVCVSPGFVIEVDSSTFGSKMPRAEWGFIGGCKVPCPSLPRQRAIAAYLDRETAKIDAMISAKERLLALLAEKRRALITHAVTRGLNEGVPMKDSGVEWLGEIPEHWDAAPLRYLVDITSGSTPDKGNAEYWGGDIPWVSPKDMNRDRIDDAEDHVTDIAMRETTLARIPTGSVLVVIRGMILAHSFPTAVTTGEVTINQDMKALRCRPLVDPEFLWAYFRGIEKHVVSQADQSAHGTKKIDTEILGALSVVLPPIEEQRHIVQEVIRQTARVDELVGQTQQSIDLGRERRSALIAAAVTGQIDVEDAA